MTNPGRAEYKRQWYQKNKERIREKQRAASRKSYAKHIEKRRAEGRAYTKKLWQTQPEKMKAKSRDNSRIWRIRNPERLRVHHRNHAIKKKYGLPPGAYERLLAKQGGVCAICKNPPNKPHLTIDHCHATGLIKGLLCDSCNLGLGMFRENPVFLRNAAKYIDAFHIHLGHFELPTDV